MTYYSVASTWIYVWSVNRWRACYVIDEIEFAVVEAVAVADA